MGVLFIFFYQRVALFSPWITHNAVWWPVYSGAMGFNPPFIFAWRVRCRSALVLLSVQFSLLPYLNTLLKLPASKALALCSCSAFWDSSISTNISTASALDFSLIWHTLSVLGVNSETWAMPSSERVTAPEEAQLRDRRTDFLNVIGE